jgi:hypothetical protein
MKLFRRGKKEEEGDGAQSEYGIIDLYGAHLAKEERGYLNDVVEHLQRIHEPGGYEREKQDHDFIDLGMARSYLDALDDIEFAVEDHYAYAFMQLRKKGMGQAVTRWTVRGVHNRELLGVPPSGEQVTIGGITYTTFRNYRLRTEYTIWELPELTRRVVST